MARTRRGKDEPTIIKKYANRRLYDTGRSSYVTLEDLCEMVKEGHNFVVVDAKSGEDLTRSVLTQIIVDQESQNGEDGGLLPTSFLRNLIGFYGDSVQGLVPKYLEGTMDVFMKNQEQMREQINKSLEGMNSLQGMNPMSQMKNMQGIFPGAPDLEELNRKNMEIFERTMKMFTQFPMQGYGGSSEKSAEDKD